MIANSRSVYRQLIPGLMLGVIVLAGMILLGGMNLVSIRLIDFKWEFFGFAVALDLLTNSLRFLKRALCLDRSGVKGISLPRSFYLFVAGFPLAATPVRVGEAYKALWLSKLSGIPTSRAESIYLVDHISDVLSVFVLTVVGTLAFPVLWPFFLVIFLLFVLASLFLQIKPANAKLLGAGDKVPILQHFSLRLRRCVEGNPSVFTFGSMSISFLLGILSWAAQGAALFFILIGLGFEPSLALIATSSLVLAFSMLMGIISNLPGGLGVIELAMAALLTILLDFRPEIAVAATLLFRLATFWIGLLFGILFWSVSGKSLGLNNKEGQIIEG